MRHVLMICGLATAGCVSEQGFVYRSTVVTHASGVAMSEDGLTSYAAMEGLTCALDVRWGCPTVEDDLPTAQEQVLDHLDGTTLASTDGRLHFLDGGVWRPERDLEVPALLTARLSDAGVLALTGEGGACSLSLDGEAHAVESALCRGASYEVDRRGALVVATDDGVLRADGTEVIRLAERGDRVSVDRATDLVYVATAGQAGLDAVGPGGEAVWSVSLDAPVRDLVARGDKGDVIVLVETDDGLGRLERRDGRTGEVRAISPVPSAEGTLAVSGNGRTIALVTDDEIHHYEIVVDGELAPEGKPVDCVDLPVPESPGVGFD